MEEKAQILKVLGDETRLEIVAMLSKENLCACQLQEAFSLSGATLSYHLKLLQESDLIYGRKEGYWTRYSLNKHKIKEIITYLEAFLKKEASHPPIRCKTK